MNGFEDVLKKKRTSDLVAINLWTNEDSKKARSQGRYATEKEDEGDGHHHENDEEVEYDEHGYLSRMRLSSASLSSRQLLRRDEKHADTYKKTSMHTLKSQSTRQQVC